MYAYMCIYIYIYTIISYMIYHIAHIIYNMISQRRHASATTQGALGARNVHLLHSSA